MPQKPTYKELEQKIKELEKETLGVKIANEELRKNEHSYRTLAENLPGIVYRVFLQENNQMEFFNDMLHPMTGYNIEELKSGQLCSIEPFIIKEDRYVEKMANLYISME